VEKLLRNEKIAVAWRQSGANGSLPYSLIVHAYSNVQFDARPAPGLAEGLGATATLTASLTEYDVPLASAAMVWTDIVGPDQKEFSLKLDDVGPGAYLATFKTLSAGVYSCRVRAEGYSSAQTKFTREKRLTAIVYPRRLRHHPSPTRMTAFVICWTVSSPKRRLAKWE